MYALALMWSSRDWPISQQPEDRVVVGCTSSQEVTLTSNDTNCGRRRNLRMLVAANKSTRQAGSDGSCP